jgi:hypothetical protein
MTDAVSQWFMHENENSEQPWEVLFQLAQETNYILEFQKWVAEMRFAKRMKNDDTTVIIASLGRVTI